MDRLDEAGLLRRFVAEGSDDAFARIVSQHLNLVYAAALRQVRDPHLAQEVAQSVFVLLARKASSLSPNVVLSGWLYRATGFVAADVLRAENRRRRRESAALEPVWDSGAGASASAEWRGVEPILDGAMAALGEGERNLLLLRFFEERSLREVGAALGISEDAAQKKVARALEKLRGILAREGAGISSTGLAGVMAAYGCSAAAPPALGASIVTAAAGSAAAAVGVSWATQAALQFMAVTKLKLAGAALALLAAASIPYVAQERSLREVRDQNVALQGAVKDLEAKAETAVANAGARVSEGELAQLRSDAAEVPKLRGQIAALLRAQGSIARPTAPRAAGNNDADAGVAAGKDPVARQSLGDKYVKEGKFAEALEQYQWCFDEGAKNSPAYAGVRNSFLLMQWAELGKKYAPAQEALRERRDVMETEALASAGTDGVGPIALVQMNRYLGEPERTFSFYDQLPERSAARGAVMSVAMEQFSDAKRYQDIVDSGKPEASFDIAIMGVEAIASAGGETGDKLAGTEAFMRRNAVQAGGRALEALAMVGETERAKALVDKILGFDKSAETKSELLKFAQRSGNAAVVAQLQGK